MDTKINLDDYRDQKHCPVNYAPLNPEKGARDRFEHAYASVPKVLPYAQGWSDGKGQHYTALQCPEIHNLKPGEIRKSITPGKRRLIAIGTLQGPVVIFERFIPKDPRGQVYVCNTTLAVEQAYDAHFELHGLQGPLSAHAMLTLLGEDPVTENIGHTLSFLNSMV